MNRRRTEAHLLLPALTIVVCFLTNGVLSAEKPLKLTSEPVGHARIGGPVFIRVRFTNLTDRKVYYWSAGQSEFDSTACIKGPGRTGDFREIPLIQDFNVISQSKASSISAGETFSWTLIWWFRADGGPGRSRSLVFQEAGKYLYRVSRDVLIGKDFDTARELRLRSEGELTFRKRARGFSTIYRGLAHLIQSDSKIRFKDRGKLDKLIKKLPDDSPYKVYVQWLRLRCCLSSEGMSLITKARKKKDKTGKRELKVLRKILDSCGRAEFLNKAGLLGTPVEFDLLQARCVTAWLEEKKQELYKTRGRIKERFGIEQMQPAIRSLSEIIAVCLVSISEAAKNEGEAAAVLLLDPKSNTILERYEIDKKRVADGRCREAHYRFAVIRADGQAAYLAHEARVTKKKHVFGIKVDEWKPARINEQNQLEFLENGE